MVLLNFKMELLEHNFSTIKIFYPIKLEMLVVCGIKISWFPKICRLKTITVVSFGKNSLKIKFIYVTSKLKDAHLKTKWS